MQVAGFNLYRILLPVFVLSILLSLLAVANQELLIPKFAEELARVEQTTFEDKEKHNIIMEDGDNNLLFRTGTLNVIEKSLKSVYVVGKYGNGKKKFTISAKDGKWRENSGWLLTKTTLHNYDENGKWVAPAIRIDEHFLETTLTPEQLNTVDVNSTLKSFKELRGLCKSEPENQRYSTMLHTRIVYPLTNFVLLFLGIPVMRGFDRMSKNVFLRVGLSMLICGAFFVLSYVCANLGNMGILHPMLAAWIPVVIFGCVGLMLFDGMRI